MLIVFLCISFPLWHSHLYTPSSLTFILENVNVEYFDATLLSWYQTHEEAGYEVAVHDILT